MINTLCW